MQEGAVVIDTRSYYAFIYGYIPGSIYLPLTHEGVEIIAKLFAGKELLLVLEADDASIGDNFLPQFKNLHVKGCLDGGFDTWKNAGRPLDMVVEIDAYEFSIDLPFDEKLYIIDVRDPAEYASEHVTGAVNMPIADFGNIATLANFEENWNLYVYGSRNEGATAISLLQRQGFHNARNISEGFAAIRKEKMIPVETGKKDSADD